MTRGEASRGAGRVRTLVAVVAVLAAMFAVTSSANATPPVRTGTAQGVIPHHKGGTTFIGQFPQFAQSLLQYYGGPVLRTNETFAIFWDPAGRFSQSYRDLIVRYLRDVAADSGRTTNVYSVLNQYYDTSGPIAYNSVYAGTAIDTNPYPAGCPVAPQYSACFNDAQLASELDAFLFANRIARPSNRAFMVFTPEGVESCFDSGGAFCSGTVFCAYHGGFTGGHGDAIYANLPYNAIPGCDVGHHPNGSAADPVIDSLSHEHKEMIDDPLAGSATSLGYPLAWYGGGESSDKCVNYFGPTRNNGVGEYNQVINGHLYLLQTEWSNALASAQGFGCVADGVDRAPTAVIGSAVAHGAVADFSGGASSDPDPGDSISSYLWDFGDGTDGAGATEHHRYDAAGTYHVQLLVTDSRGASSSVARDVVISSPTPAPPHAFKVNLGETLDDLAGFSFGDGNATGIGNVSEFGFVRFGFRDFPVSITVAASTRLSTKSGDTLVVIYRATWVDTASPPQGNNYDVSGHFSIQGGTGRFLNAFGSGAITGTCTSSFTSDIAHCSVEWKGTIAGD